MHRKIFFNSFLRSIQKGYLAFSLAFLISLQKNHGDAKIEAVSALFTSFLLSLPIFAALFFQKYIHKLCDDEFTERFGSLYLNLKDTSLISTYHTILYFVRRLIYAAIIVFLGAFPSLQNIIFVITSVGLLAFQFAVKPMEDRQSQYMEIYNEFTIMTIGCFLTPFSSDQFDKSTR